jgi:NDP-hexose 4,6-dehydratase
MSGDKFWQGKRVLITGADGFIGSHLTEHLVTAGGSVVVFVRGTPSTYISSRRSLRNLSQEVVDSLSDVVLGDIATVDTVDLICDAEPDVVFHLAASGHVSYSISHVAESLGTVLLGSMHVLEAAKRCA